MPRKAKTKHDVTREELEVRLATYPMHQRLKAFPRRDWDGIDFGYPLYCFEPGHVREKILWSVREAGRAWETAWDTGNLDAALPPGFDPRSEDERREALRKSLFVVLIGNSLQINEWFREVRAEHGVYHRTFEDWISGVMGRDYAHGTAWQVLSVGLRDHPFRKETWLFDDEETMETALDISAVALNAFWRRFKDSQQAMVMPTYTKLEALVSPWFPRSKEELPPQPFLVGLWPWQSTEDVTAEAMRPGWRYFDGRIKHKLDDAEREHARTWWEVHQSKLDLPEPPLWPHDEFAVPLASGEPLSPPADTGDSPTHSAAGRSEHLAEDRGSSQEASVVEQPEQAAAARVAGAPRMPGTHERDSSTGPGTSEYSERDVEVRMKELSLDRGE